MLSELSYKLFIKTHYDLNNIQIIHTYVWKVRREVYGIHMTNFSIILMNGLIHYYIV